MSDPNITYKLAFAELQAKLGRVPTANECLGLHDAYKASFEEEKNGRNMHSGTSKEVSRNEQEARVEVAARSALPSRLADEPLIGPDKPAEPDTPVSEPEPPANKPRPSERPIAGTRGPGGGIVAVCRGCGREFERPARKGRPPVKCEECR